jgi:hypothetical protein
MSADAPTTSKDQIPQVGPDKPLFANNAGISGKAFIDKHTYFQDTDKAQVSKVAQQAREDFLTQTLKKTENSIKNKEVEHSYIFDKYSNELVYKVGNEDFISFTKEELQLIKDNIFTHNHIVASFFSYGDIATTIGNNLYEMRAVQPNGDIYILTRPTNGWGVSFDELIEAIDNLKYENSAKFYNNQISKQEYDKYLTEGLAKDLLKMFNLTYQIEKL